MWILKKIENIVLNLNEIDFCNHLRIIDLKLSKALFSLEVNNNFSSSFNNFLGFKRKNFCSNII